MGGGTTKKQAAPRAKTLDIEAGLSPGAELAAMEGSGPTILSPTPCERPRPYAFRLRGHGTADIRAGASIRLQPFRPPIVICGGNAIGDLSDPDSEEAIGCMAAGYRLTGVVVELDDMSATGFVEVVGRKDFDTRK